MYSYDIISVKSGVNENYFIRRRLFGKFFPKFTQDGHSWYSEKNLILGVNVLYGLTSVKETKKKLETKKLKFKEEK